MTAQLHYELNFDGPPGSGGTAGAGTGAPKGAPLEAEMAR